jgi:hypothetical protein
VDHRDIVLLRLHLIVKGVQGPEEAFARRLIIEQVLDVDLGVEPTLLR